MAEAQEIGWMGVDNYDSDLDVALFGGRNGMALAEMAYDRIRDRIADRIISRPVGSISDDRREKYLKFISFHEKHGLNSGNFDRDCTQKRRSLILHFPARFSFKGSQPIRDYNCTDIGALYKNILNHAHGYISRQ